MKHNIAVTTILFLYCTLCDRFFAQEFILPAEAAGLNQVAKTNGDLTFSDATTQFGLEDEGNGMGVTVADYNNDGYVDICPTNIAGCCQRNPLFTNQGDGTFINTAAEMGLDDAGWAWGTEFFDCDHDGDVDLYVVNGFSDNFTSFPGHNLL